MLKDIGSVAIISALVSFTTTIFLKIADFFFQSRIEAFRQKINLRFSLKSETIKRKLVAYRIFASQIYRIRNTCKLIIDQINLSKFDSSLLNKIRETNEQLETLLYEYRTDLTSDGLFSEIHYFKNIVIDFSLQLNNYIKLPDSSYKNDHTVINVLNSIWSEINTKHLDIIDLVTGFTTKLCS